jgi:general secretion pathway protein A
MYTAWFGLNEKPFAITPDPRYLYLSARHAEALAHLVYGLGEAGGFIQLTGEVGTGKTTTIRSVLARAPKNTDIALIINPRMSPVEFVQTICEELGLGLPDVAEGNLKELIDVLNRYLLKMHAAGRRVVLIVDEAQQLAPEVLEQVRLLTNLETESQKLLQIILIGQPELRELLARNELRQLSQRITARYHLDPLSADETAGYVRHRLQVAGASTEIFPAPALREAHRLSGGIPRVINILCDRALLGAYTREQRQVNRRLLRLSAGEVFDHRIAPSWLTPVASTLGAALLLAAGYAAWRFGPWNHAAAATMVPTSVTATVPVNSPPGSAAPVATLTSLAAVLAEPGLATSAEDALTNLLQLWRGQYRVGGDDACAQALQQQFECVSLRATLAELRELNRPAVLLLNAGSPNVQHVLITELATDTAHLKVGKREVDVSIADLSRSWFGDLILLWKPPTETVSSLARGAKGPAVRELRRRLLQWNNAVLVGEVSAAYDEDLANLVEDFQKSHHLTPDGVAGLDTQLMLDGAIALASSPRLMRDGGSK